MHADQHGASRMVGESILRAKEVGLLTDANVQSATTPASLKALISVTTGHADEQPLRSRMNRMIDIGIDDGTINTTDISAATSVVGLAGLTQTDTTHTAGGPVY
jgi:hypothetical protein